jgi:hypothetical protein
MQFSPEIIRQLVVTDKSIRQEEVVLHLSEAVQLNLNMPEHNHRPQDSLVLPGIDWSEMREQGPASE